MEYFVDGLLHIRAREEVSANGKEQEPLDLPEPHSVPWYKQIFKWESLTMATGRTIEKGWVVPQSLGVALIIAMLSCTGVLYWRVVDKQTAQDKEYAQKNQELREMMVRIDQRLLDKNERDKEQIQELKQAVTDTQSQARAVEFVVNKELAALKAKR